MSHRSGDFSNLSLDFLDEVGNWFCQIEERYLSEVLLFGENERLRVFDE